MPFDGDAKAMVLIKIHARNRARLPIRKYNCFANQFRLGLRERR
jgi:hypothetical protein